MCVVFLGWFWAVHVDDCFLGYGRCRARPRCHVKRPSRNRRHHPSWHVGRILTLHRRPHPFSCSSGLWISYPLVSVFHVLIIKPTQQIISTFISHTIASVLLVPIAKEVGSNLPGHHQNLLIFITGLICSAGMGMPVSGFPNQTASVPTTLHVLCHTGSPDSLGFFSATVEDELGELYLSNVDFLKNGVPASIIATLVSLLFFYSSPHPRYLLGIQ
jgi:hypothetical protein